MSKLLSLLFVFGLSLGLIGCRTIWDPTFMPAGYTYHGDEYKAPPGPEADSLGYEYSAAKNAEILEIWQMAAVDLVNQLEEQTGPMAQPIYINKNPGHNAFNASYDHVLRDELRSRGYTLLSRPDPSSPSLWYEAHIPVDATKDETPVYNDDASADEEKPSATQKDFVLILSLVQNGTLIGKAAGVYQVPSYGFVEYKVVELDLVEPTIEDGPAQ